ncbi:MAG: hypothetical protein AB7S75_01520 [Desulfococcaceae bacterium]
MRQNSFFSPYAGFFRPETDDFSLSASQSKIMPDKTKIGSVYKKAEQASSLFIPCTNWKPVLFFYFGILYPKIYGTFMSGSFFAWHVLLTPVCKKMLTYYLLIKF